MIDGDGYQIVSVLFYEQIYDHGRRKGGQGGP